MPDEETYVHEETKTIKRELYKDIAQILLLSG